MQMKWFAALGLAGAVVAGAAFAAEVGGSSTPPNIKAPGYLRRSELPDAGQALGPPPAEGVGTKAGDIETYRTTRKLEGTPRWALAARDADFGPEPMMRTYSCAVGVALDRRTAPRLYRLFDRLVTDSNAVNNTVKAGYKRSRPFVENDGPICVAKEDWLRQTFSYPSGHSTYSWSAGLTLSRVVPDRTAAIMSRARAYGESRIVCGVHYESDVQAGRATASILFDALQASPAFQADVAAAKREVARLRARRASPRPDPAECAVEAEASQTPVW